MNKHGVSRFLFQKDRFFQFRIANEKKNAENFEHSVK